MNRFLKTIFSSKGKVKEIFLNKYYVSVFVFLIVTFCIGDSTLQKRYAYDQEINRLQKEIEYHRKLKDENSMKLESLNNDNESLEKYAREQFQMTKPNEDLFIIIP